MLLTTGKKYHYYVDVKFQFRNVAHLAVSEQKNYTGFPHDTLEVVAAVQKGSFPHNKNLFNFDSSIL